MADFPPPDSFGPPESSGYAGDFSGPPPWSGTAISGFVCSFFSCLVVPALLGVFLAIFGLVATSGGRKRGRGLAIAALPISASLGLMGVWGSYVFVSFITETVNAPARIQEVLGLPESESTQAAANLRLMASADFNEAVSDDQLQSWLQAVREEYGQTTEVESSADQPIGPDGKSLNLYAKFVTGKTEYINIRLEPAREGLRIRYVIIDDITVGDLSPRLTR